MYKKILMPVDIFEMDLSDKAIRHAVYLAGESGEITLLNVLPNSNRSIVQFCAVLLRILKNSKTICSRNRQRK